MASSNGHSKRPIPKARRPKKSSKAEKTFLKEAYKAIFKRQGRNN